MFLFQIKSLCSPWSALNAMAISTVRNQFRGEKGKKKKKKKGKREEKERKEKGENSVFLPPPNFFIHI